MHYILQPIFHYWNFITKVPRNRKSRKAWEGMVLYDICVIGMWSLVFLGIIIGR